MTWNTVRKLQKFTPTIALFAKKFMKPPQWKIMAKRDHAEKKIREINSLVTSLAKTLI